MIDSMLKLYNVILTSRITCCSSSNSIEQQNKFVCFLHHLHSQRITAWNSLKKSSFHSRCYWLTFYLLFISLQKIQIISSALNDSWLTATTVSHHCFSSLSSSSFSAFHLHFLSWWDDTENINAQNQMMKSWLLFCSNSNF